MEDNGRPNGGRGKNVIERADEAVDALRAAGLDLAKAARGGGASIQLRREVAAVERQLRRS